VYTTQDICNGRLGQFDGMCGLERSVRHILKEYRAKGCLVNGCSWARADATDGHENKAAQHEKAQSQCKRRTSSEIHDVVLLSQAHGTRSVTGTFGKNKKDIPHLMA
jgi:hypothetical protein